MGEADEELSFDERNDVRDAERCMARREEARDSLVDSEVRDDGSFEGSFAGIAKSRRRGLFRGLSCGWGPSVDSSVGGDGCANSRDCGVGGALMVGVAVEAADEDSSTALVDTIESVEASLTVSWVAAEVGDVDALGVEAACF